MVSEDSRDGSVPFASLETKDGSFLEAGSSRASSLHLEFGWNDDVRGYPCCVDRPSGKKNMPVVSFMAPSWSGNG